MRGPSYLSLPSVVSILVLCSGGLLVGGGWWVMEDYNDTTEAAEIIKKELDVRPSSEDYYSVFNKKGGWGNVGYVSIGVGVVSVVLALMGFIGVHEETIFLLLAYIVLLIINIMLNIAVVIIILRRHSEIRIFEQTNPSDNLKTKDKFVFFISALSFAAFTLVASIIAALIRRTALLKKNIEEDVFV